MVSNQIVNLKTMFQFYFFPSAYLTQFSMKINEVFRACTEGIDLNAGKCVSDYFI